MTQRAHHQRMGSVDARMGWYNGAETVAVFTEPDTELRTLVSGCGILDLAWRAMITVKGRDRVRWLNGMVTNTIKGLPANHGNYNFVLNPQGRILGDMYIYNREEHLVLETDRSQLEAVTNTLKRFIIMDQVELADASGSLYAIGLCGPDAEELLRTCGIDISGLQALEVREAVLDEKSINVVQGPEQKPGWFEIWCAPEHTEKIWEVLVKAGAQPAGTDALELWRILRGIPNYGQDIRERDLPQETEQMQALNFAKGCYIGQEIVERIRSRGQVHRKFTGFQFPGNLPNPGKFEENSKVVAEITSIAEVEGRKIGLGYVRRENGLPGTQLSLGGTAAIVSDLPFPMNQD